MKIVVLAGGYSPERNVSLVTAALITQALRENQQQAVFVDAYLGLPEISQDRLADLFSELPVVPNFSIEEAKVDLKALKKARKAGGQGVFGPNVLALCQQADLVFMGLHGEAGENGKMQGTFDLLEIPYTGSGALASALAMDKKIAKSLLAVAGILVPQDCVYVKGQPLQEKLAQLSYPLVVKPLAGGSSLGVSLVSSMQEAEAAVLAACEFGTEVLLEEYILGREFSVGFLDSQILPPIELIPGEGFYDYRHKYQPGLTQEICPPENLAPEILAEMQTITAQVKGCLNLSVYGRVDFLLAKTGELYVIEANTLPGMTPTSLLPQEAQVADLTFPNLCQRIAELSLEKVAGVSR